MNFDEIMKKIVTQIESAARAESFALTVAEIYEKALKCPDASDVKACFTACKEHFGERETAIASLFVVLVTSAGKDVEDEKNFNRALQSIMSRLCKGEGANEALSQEATVYLTLQKLPGVQL